MSALLDIARPPTLFDAPASAAPAAPVAPGQAVDAAVTLESLVDHGWGELAAGRTIACPVCAGPMAPVYGAGALPLGGRCGGCEARLG